MEVVLFIVLLTIILIYVINQFRRNGNTTKGTPLPGPKQLPVLGNALQVDSQNLHQSVSDMVKDYGAIFKLSLMGQNTVFINDPELLRKAFGSSVYGDILNDRPASFVGKYLVFSCNDIIFGDANKTTMEKRKAWKKAHKLYGDGIDHFEQTAEVEMKRLLADLNKTNQLEFDSYRLLRKSVANTMVIFLTGSLPEEHDSKYLWQLNDFTNMAFEELNMFIYDLIPFVRLLPGTFGRMFRSGTKARDMILERCYLRTTASDQGERNGFVNALIQIQSENDRKNSDDFLDETNIKGIILDVVMAATGSIAIALTNTLALLMVHQHVAKRIQEEIDNTVGNGRLPRVSDKDKMPYTLATVYESLRYTSGAGPLGFPHLAKNDVIFEGFNIEKGSVALGNLWFIHHDPKLWTDPWIFKPERFLDAEGRFLPPDNEIHRNFMAFGTGRRNCLGADLAKSRMFLYLAMILQSYDIALGSEGIFPDINPRNYIPGGELRVKDFLCRAIPRK